MAFYYKKYGIDAYLYADIGTVILLVLSDCIGLVPSAHFTA